MQTRFLRQHAAALSLAAAAVGLVVVRACVQNITIDEATSYLLYASRGYSESQWYPASGNHVLNSLLMRLVTVIFGMSELTVRMPAILGAIIYISSAFYLCSLLTRRQLLRLGLLICLIYNPIVLDYLVAARGYSLASGFLLAAIALMANITIAGEHQDPAAIRRKCAWASALVALSFCANFSFAIADGTAMLLFFLWLARQYRKSGRPGTLLLAISCFLPGIAVAFVICGSVVLDWPKGQLYFGSQSLTEMWQGLSEATFDYGNPNIVNPLILPWFNRLRTVLPYVTLVTILLLLAAIEIGRFRARLGQPVRRIFTALLDVKVLLGNIDDDQPASPNTNGSLAFTRLLVLIVVTTLLLHWLAFNLVHLLLPKDRTALFFVTLLTLAFGGMLAVRLPQGKRDITGAFGLGVLMVVGVYFFGCLRLDHLKEWPWDSDTKQIYWLLTDLNRRCGITDFAVDWRYHVAMNFYREAYGNSSLKEFSASSSGELPTDKTAYAIFLPSSEDFIKQQRLQVIYRNDDSGSVVAIRGCPAPKN